MEKYLSIGEVSRLLDIPESTLRFWQDKGIFSVEKGENNYRQYTVYDLTNIAEIAFYRNLGMPVRQMGRFNQFCFEDYDKVLGSVKDTLQAKIEMYTAMYESACLKSEHIKSIQYLKTVDYTYEKVPFGTLVRFEYSDREQLIRYTQNPSLYVRLMDSRDPEHDKNDIRGIIVSSVREHDTLIWQKKKDSLYAVFLIEEIASENYVNDISKKLGTLQKKHKTGILLANFLLGETVDGKRIDYLKAYVEILDS